MNSQEKNPFETIESAHHFMALLSEAVAEARQEIENDAQRERSLSESRRMDALRMALYSLEKLELHITRSSRILNDLRTLRRLLFSERINASASEEPQAQRLAIAASSHRREKASAVTEEKHDLALEQSA
jgi:hypothetical protein